MIRQLLTHRCVSPLAALIVSVSGLLGSSGAAAVESSAEWGQYRDKEAGLVFDLPAHIFPPDSAKQGRVGTVFTSRDGRAQVRVFGSANEVNDTPQRHLNRIAGSGERADFTYVRTTPTFYVASGTRDGVISYRRCNFSRSGENRIGCIQLNYPQRDKRAWDAPVTRMSRSLRLVARD
jgi:hypothetical protein